MNDLIKYLLKNNNKIKIHSKDIKSGDVFVALKGKNLHGNKFISEALRLGSKYVITDKVPLRIYKVDKIFVIKNVFSFLNEIAVRKRKNYKGKIIGITGSIGKTSVKENLKYFISKKFKVFASIKSYNNYLGVIISLINLDLKSKYAIFELGTNNFNEIKKLTSMVKPSQVIITNIFPTHLENFLNTRNIAKEKSDILNDKYNPKVELAILPNNNSDEKFIIKKAKKQKISNIITFGRNIDSNIRISNIVFVGRSEYKINIIFKEKKIEFSINANQLHRIDNIIICLLIFIYNNISLKLFKSYSVKIPLIEGRGIKKIIFINNKKINFIDESYNASPHSMKTCVDYFCDLKINSNQKKYLIMGEMKELGEKSLKFHIDLLNYILRKKLENVIICGELMQIALEKTNNKSLKFMKSKKSIFEHIKKVMKDDDILLIKGSNSSMTYNLTHEFLLKGEN